MSVKLTEKQQGFVGVTSELVGKTFNVATSQHSNSKATGYWSDYEATTTSQALVGLEKKGFIKIEDKFWRGATVTRLK